MVEMRERTCEDLRESLFYLLSTILHTSNVAVQCEITEGVEWHVNLCIFKCSNTPIAAECRS